MKMNTLTWVALGIGGFWLYSKYRQGQAASNFLVNVDGFQSGGLNIPYWNVTLRLRVVNNSPVTVTAQRVWGTLKKNNAELGSFSVQLDKNQQITVPANSIQMIDVNAQINVVAAAMSIIQSGYTNIVLDGKLMVDNIQLPFSYALT